MISSLYFKIPRRIKIFVIFLFIILAAYLISRFLLDEPRNIPDEFLKARQQASLIAQEIVVLSERTTNSLDSIADLDRERKYTEALTLISQEIEYNKSAREKAFSLSGQLEIMAKNISAISPPSAGQKALEAINLEIILINRLINYNDYLVQLLEVLRLKFLGREKNSAEKIQNLIKKINEETRAINELNRKFNEAMNDLDSV